MEGFLRFLGWLFLIFLAYLILGFDERKWKQRVKELKAEYKKTNEDYVRRYKEDKRIEEKAKLLAQATLLVFYSCVAFSFWVICSYYQWETVSTIFIGIGYYGLLSSPVSHVLFGRDMGAASLYQFFNGKIRGYLNHRNNFNAALLPVSLKKREEKREELLSVLNEKRK